MNVVTKTTTVIKTHRVAIMMDHSVAHAILALLEMEHFVKILMNVLSEIMTVMETRCATTMMVHLVAHAILASLEMEPIAKI